MAKIRTRFAPSPTGSMHIGNLRSALFEYLIAKHKNGDFILRIEDTDQQRFVPGATETIYNTLRLAGLRHDEGPDVGGDYGPYIQSERKAYYMEYAERLIDEGKAYYCFCTRERLESLHREGSEDAVKYDRLCHGMPKQEARERIGNGELYVIRQLIPDTEGSTSFHDEVYGDITFPNSELDDQVLIKSDGMPTYNFANVIDDHLMAITHVVRGSEYLSSTPKYSLLYEAFGWEVPVYVHLPLLLNQQGEKMSKRKGDKSFEELVEAGFLPEAVVNYIAFLGWSPAGNQEIFTLSELEGAFEINGISKSPATFDLQKLTWMNGEHFKRMGFERFFGMAEPVLVGGGVLDAPKYAAKLKQIARMVQSRINFLSEIPGLVDFLDALPEYDIELYTHKKMKTDPAVALPSLRIALDLLDNIDGKDYNNDNLYSELCKLAEANGLKNGQVLWPVRTALSGKPSSPCGASELCELLEKEETVKRIQAGIEKLMD